MPNRSGPCDADAVSRRPPWRCSSRARAPCCRGIAASQRHRGRICAPPALRSERPPTVADDYR
ncbi:hypothetical protein BMAJHU_I0902 [Burkholderia mallei JHU]|nr:hypothetical protein BMAJHU_I0902 [Burkholderia mallei JHU]